MERRLPILMFHAVDDGPSPLSFPPRAFREGMERLAGEGAASLACSGAVRLLGDGLVPERAFAVTFDDGYRSVFDAAFPVLQRLGMTATVFLSPSADPRSGERPPAMEGRERLSWAEVSLLAEAGWEIGSHSLAHRVLPGLCDGELRREVEGSRRLLEKRLGRPVASFAYPYGRWDRRCLSLVRSLYRCACTTRLGFAGPRSDPHLLERIEAHYLRGDGLLGRLHSPGVALRLALRRPIRRAGEALRERGLGP